jgi:hypothetical protein
MRVMCNLNLTRPSKPLFLHHPNVPHLAACTFGQGAAQPDAGRRCSLSTAAGRITEDLLRF